MKFNKKYSSFFSFTDILFNTLIGFVLLFITSFLLITPVTKNNVKTKAEFVITTTWDNEKNDDVDVWIEDPLGNILWYGGRSIGLMHLDKDDLGHINDKVILPTGEEVVLKINQEIATIRGFISGEWILNVHMFRKESTDPTTVNVRVDKLNPIVRPVAIKTVTLVRHFQEVTVIRFTMDSNGNILNLNELPKPLANDFSRRSEN